MTQASRAPEPWNKLRQHPHTLTHGLALLLLACQRGNEREAPCHPCEWVEVHRAPGYVLLSPSPCQIRPGRLPAPKVCLTSYSVHEALIPFPPKSSLLCLTLLHLATTSPCIKPPPTHQAWLDIYHTPPSLLAEVPLRFFNTPTVGWYLSMFRSGNISLLPSP